MENAFLHVLNTITARKVITYALQIALLAITCITKIIRAEKIVKIRLVKRATIPRIFAFPVMMGNIFTEDIAGISVLMA